MKDRRTRRYASEAAVLDDLNVEAIFEQDLSTLHPLSSWADVSRHDHHNRLMGIFLIGVFYIEKPVIKGKLL